MPKYKKSYRVRPPQAEVSAQRLMAEQVHVNHEVDVKIEPDYDDSNDEFDPMQYESTKIVLLNEIQLAARAETGHEPKIDAIKPECDIDIVNSFRPEMIENSHEFAYMTRSNILRKEIVNAATNPKREKKESKFIKTSILEPVKIEMNGRKLLKCPLCDERTSTRFRTKIKRHIRQAHARDKPFKCGYCLATYPSLSALRKHKESEHKKEKIQCEKCRMIFYEDKKLELHKLKCGANRSSELIQVDMETIKHHEQRMHTNEEVFDCSVQDNERCQKHEKKCRTKRRFECHVCTKYGSFSFSKFMRHMAIHTGIQIIKCNGCPKSFGSYVRLAEHISRSDHSQLLATFCPNCCFRFSSKADRDAHQINCSRKRFECYLCYKTSRISKTLKGLKNHITYNHTGLKRFSCKFCSRKFGRESNLKKHQKTHTKVDLIKCQYCTKKFIDMHYKKRHENSCRKTYECYLCHKKFPSFAILNDKHMKTHRGLYQCKHCNARSSASPRTYALHVIDKHLHLYEFLCQSCNGIVERRQDLRKHQNSCNKSAARQARDIKYFKCSRCGKGLARMLQVKKHILSGECENHPKAK